MFKLVLVLLAVLQEESLLEKLEREISGVVRKARPSVVAVEVRAGRAEPLQLSGIVYRKDGYIVTDAGAVSKAESIRVVLWNGRGHAAKVVGSDARTGVAVLRVDAPDLAPVEPARTSELGSGSFAIVVGNAYGLRGSASVGTLAGIDRSIRVAGRRFDSMLQLTAAAHPGDCGAFVADSRGRLIGLVHSTLGTDEEEGRFWRELFDLRGTSSGPITFAVPVESVRFAADRIIKHGRMVRGWIGISVRTTESGVEVLKIESGGPALRAGFRSGDVIVAWDGESVRDAALLQRKVEAHEEPKTVKVAALRERLLVELEVRVELEPERK